jgi:DNA polymerase II small subunit
MVDEEWANRQRQLTAAGLLVLGKAAQERIQRLSDISSLIEAAQRSNVVMLSERVVEEMLTLVPTEEAIDAHQGTPRSEQATLPDPESQSAIGRTLAPVGPQVLSPPVRRHGLDHYNLDDFPMQAKDVDSEIEIHFDITGNSTTEGKMGDIRSCFSDRLRQIRQMMISGRVLPRRPISVSEAWRNRQRHSSKDYEVTLVGLVSVDKWSKGGYLWFDIEDDSMQVRCMLKEPTGASSFHPSLDGLMNDDVVGVDGHFNLNRDPYFVVSDVHMPPLGRHSKSAASEAEAVSAAFLSDVHVGSKTFLAPQWEKMIEWFRTDPLARTVKYFVLSGDGVDGVGIYPGQERHLAIKDLFNQYGELARLLENLPDWVDLMILPGNHDAVRPAEPQPALDPEVQQDYSDAVFVGNPCDFSLHGVRILSYHGKSIDDFVAGLRSVTYSSPELAMRAMMERRHLAPSWGGKTPLSPEPEDRMVISTVPDIFVTGHVHGHYVGNHKGTTMVHSSTWQDQTDYQRMLGFQPKPCILTIVNLHTHATASIPFA